MKLRVPVLYFQLNLLNVEVSMFEQIVKQIRRIEWQTQNVTLHKRINLRVKILCKILIKSNAQCYPTIV